MSGITYNDEVTGSNPVTPTPQTAGQSIRETTASAALASCWACGPSWGRPAPRRTPVELSAELGPCDSSGLSWRGRCNAKVACLPVKEARSAMLDPWRPQNLVGILLNTYWTALADDPLSALLFTALASTAIVLLALVVDVAAFLVAQLLAAVL
jgi:hypothetical protein